MDHLRGGRAPSTALTIDDDLLPFRELTHTLSERLDRDVQRALNMTTCELGGATDI
jgi:hypothetical protein